MSTNTVLGAEEPFRFTGTMNRISKLRDDRGWSQADLAKKLRTTAVSVGRYEKQDNRLTLPLLRNIAKIFGTSVAVVIGEAEAEGTVPVPAYDIRAAAGSGAVALNTEPKHYLHFREQWLRGLASNIGALIVLEIRGDSMWETLHDGDHALIDRNQKNPRREGLYVLRIDDDLVVKRLSMHPVTKLLTIKSDNPQYPTYTDINPEDVVIEGRVVWIGRALG